MSISVGEALRSVLAGLAALPLGGGEAGLEAAGVPVLGDLGGVKVFVSEAEYIHASRGWAEVVAAGELLRLRVGVPAVYAARATTEPGFLEVLRLAANLAPAPLGRVAVASPVAAPLGGGWVLLDDTGLWEARVSQRGVEKARRLVPIPVCREGSDWVAVGCLAGPDTLAGFAEAAERYRGIYSVALAALDSARLLGLPLSTATPETLRRRAADLAAAASRSEKLASEILDWLPGAPAPPAQPEPPSLADYLLQVYENPDTAVRVDMTLPALAMYRRGEVVVVTTPTGVKITMVAVSGDAALLATSEGTYTVTRGELLSLLAAAKPPARGPPEWSRLLAEAAALKPGNPRTGVGLAATHRTYYTSIGIRAARGSDKLYVTVRGLDWSVEVSVPSGGAAAGAPEVVSALERLRNLLPLMEAFLERLQ